MYFVAPDVLAKRSYLSCRFPITEKPSSPSSPWPPLSPPSGVDSGYCHPLPGPLERVDFQSTTTGRFDGVDDLLVSRTPTKVP